MSLFGDIVEPTSRVAWEDWDDGEFSTRESPAVLQWQKETAIPEKIQTLLLFEGKYLLECLKSQTQYSLELINKIPEATLDLYKEKTTESYICVIKEYNLLQSSEIVELLKPYILVSKDYVSIQIKSHVDYQETCRRDENCIIRSVSTSQCRPKEDTIVYPKLEQPNIMSGISAGVISLREHLELAGIALLCYMEYSDEYQVEEINMLLKRLNILQNIDTRPNCLLNSNLYI